MKIGSILVIRKRATSVADRVAEELALWAGERSIRVFDAETTPNADADIAVVLGGDGTFLSAARIIGGRNIPILGVNLGSLGFLTEIALEELTKTLEDVEDDRARIERRMMVSVSVERGGKRGQAASVLNDVVVNKGTMARISDLEVSVGGAYLTTYRADGLIVATPTGSTAYSMSAGGSIVSPGVAALLITPICPHAMTQRPIILPPDKEIAITIGKKNGDIYVTLDGQINLELDEGDRVLVSRSDETVMMVCSPTRDYFSVLRSKLMWGAGREGEAGK